MTWREFQETHNFRITEKCCMTCKHGLEDYDGECDCRHPLIDADDRWRATDTIANVCDLWERASCEHDIDRGL